MTRTVFNPKEVPRLAAVIRQNWTRATRDLNGVKPLASFEEMGKKGYLTKDELKRIGAEKSPRRKALLNDNDEGVVQDVTRRAFTANSERHRVEMLRSLHGVDVPTASAILSWTKPDRWPVIDQRAWRTLFDHGVVTGHKDGTGLKSIQWVTYVDAVYALQRELSDKKLSPQQIDRILYELDKPETKSKRRRCRP